MPDAATIALLFRSADLMLELVDGRFDADSMPQRLFELFGALHAAAGSLGTADGRIEPARSEDTEPSGAPAAEADDQAIEQSAEDVRAETSVAAREPTGESGADAVSASEAATSDEPAVAEGEAADVLATSLVRVPLQRIERLSQLVGELVIGRAGVEQQLTRLTGYVDELRMTCERLRRIVHEMEARYGVSALGGRIGFAADASPASRVVSLTPSRFEEFDELEFDRYTEFHLLTRSLAESTNDVHTIGY